jgi:hypothetical protein
VLPLSRAIAAAIDLIAKPARLNARHELVVFIYDYSRLMNSKGVVVMRDQAESVFKALIIVSLETVTNNPFAEVNSRCNADSGRSIQQRKLVHLSDHAYK